MNILKTSPEKRHEIAQIDQFLSTLGLKEQEREVYFVILEKSLLTAGEIARITSIKRSSVYEVLSKLEEYRLIRSRDHTKTKTFSAEPPHTIKAALEEKLATFQAIADTWEKIQDNIFVPETNIVTGVSAKETLLRELGNPQSEICSFLTSQTEVTDLFLDANFLHSLAASDGSLRLIRPRGHQPTRSLLSSLNEKIQIKFLPPDSSFEGEFIVFDTTLIFVYNFNELTTITIKNTPMADAIKAVFENIWHHAM